MRQPTRMEGKSSRPFRAPGPHVRRASGPHFDHALIEIKAVQSGCHHERHLGQLFAYYLVSQAPVERVHPFEIKQLAIYYADTAP